MIWQHGNELLIDRLYVCKLIFYKRSLFRCNTIEINE
jgi:hypothetical protein